MTKITILSPGALSFATGNLQYSIVDARPYANYIAGHIPGAVWMHWDTWCEQAPTYANPELAQAGYWGMLKDSAPEVLAEQLGLLGLSSDRPILVYADGPRSKGREGRIVWMLLYLGASHVFLLDGGWSGWLKQGGNVEISPPTPERGQFQVMIQEHRRVRLSQLKQAFYAGRLPLLIDVRSRLEFVGESFAYQPRMGRLPAAIHVPFIDLFDEEGSFISKEAYMERISSLIHGADRIVAYCEVGVRSCIFALLHEVYTNQVVANFDGSLMEWALDEELPMEKG